MIAKYKTVAKYAQSEFNIKRSKFISTIKEVRSQEEVDKFIEDISKEYWDATHNCYAYKIGDNDQIQKFSDDGEPQGTAGKPILDVLHGKELKNTVIVVTRYYGGIQLGAGGLVRSYSKGAKDAVASSGIVECVLMRRYKLVVSYSLSGKVEYLLNENNHIIEDTKYTDEVNFIVLVENTKCEEFESQILEQTNAEIEIIKEDTDYVKRGIKDE